MLIISGRRRSSESEGEPVIDYDLITTRFAGRHPEHAADAVRLGTFQVDGSSRRGFVGAKSLFPDKVRSLDGRIVRLAMFNYKPYSVWEEVVRKMS